MPTLNDLITRSNITLDQLESLLNQQTIETLIKNNTGTPDPTFDDVWTLKQNTATSGIFIGSYKLADSGSGCATIRTISAVSHTNPTSGKPARFLACGASVWQDADTLQDLVGKQVSEVEIRSGTAFN